MACVPGKVVTLNYEARTMTCSHGLMEGLSVENVSGVETFNLSTNCLYIVWYK